MAKAAIITLATAEVPASDAIEQDFIDALNRLRNGKPRNKNLAVEAKRGQLRINVVNVAKEAGHSRTLIGHKACKYPNTRDRILALKTDPENPTRMQDIVAKRREEAVRLRRQLSLAQSQNATLLARILQLDGEVLRLTRLVDRLRTRKPPTTIVKLPRGI